MKKIVSILMVIILSTQFAISQQVTTFLGIPVDGTKREVIKSLERKGFVNNPKIDLLEGEFNGEDVYISVVTNNNKVCRIAVVDKLHRSEADIIVRFNNLAYQFSQNSKYLSSSENYNIPEDEDIEYNISIRNKIYQSVYYQSPFNIDCYDRPVWFRIGRYLGEFYLILFYDNRKNQSNGEEL